MDPLSNVLSLLKPQNYMSAGFDAADEWAIQFPDQQKGIKCGAVVSGSCWVSVEDAGEPVLFQAGDCFLLPGGKPFRMASDMAAPLVPAAEVFSRVRRDGIVTHNGGGDFLLVSSRFSLAGPHGDILLKMLPPIVHIRDAGGQAALRWSVERMMEELRAPQPGGFLVVQNLAHMILVQALRLHLADGSRTGVGWLFALADRQMSTAMTAIHDDPARRWTLETLAALAGMSRSVFALRFKQTVGISPMEYLTQWRMLLASDRLANSRDPIAVIAPSLGYESETAFSTAFRRVMGCSPRQYSSRGMGTNPASIAPGAAAA